MFSESEVSKGLFWPIVCNASVMHSKCRKIKFQKHHSKGNNSQETGHFDQEHSLHSTAPGQPTSSSHIVCSFANKSTYSPRHA